MKVFSLARARFRQRLAQPDLQAALGASPAGRVESAAQEESRKYVPGKRRINVLGVSLSVRLPQALLAELDLLVVELNEAAAHDLAADPVGRTEVIRRAIAEYLERRHAASPTFAKITARAAQIRAEQLAADGEEDITMAAVQAVAESLGGFDE